MRVRESVATLFVPEGVPWQGVDVVEVDHAVGGDLVVAGGGVALDTSPRRVRVSAARKPSALGRKPAPGAPQAAENAF
jgi:hypothetical protein